MTITAAPTVPNPDSASFAKDAYPFTQWMAALVPEINAETARINAIGFGAYSATSTTSLAVGTGSKSLTINTGKGYVAGQALLIASTAGPTNYMVGNVTSYNISTGALVVNVTATGGSGTVAAWTVSVSAIVVSGVSPDSIVVLTSGTSWTCPAGVTKVIGRVEGGSGGGGASGGAGGGGGGGVYFISTVIPGTAYTYSIGAGGTGAAGANLPGGGGSMTSITIGGVSFNGNGGNGGGGGSSGTGGLGGSGSAGAAGAGQWFTQLGTPGSNSMPNNNSIGGISAFGGGIGGTGGLSGGPGTMGRIVLELYK